MRLDQAIIEDRKRPRRATQKPDGDLGFEAKLWLAADKLRGNLDAAEGCYGHL